MANACLNHLKTSTETRFVHDDICSWDNLHKSMLAKIRPIPVNGDAQPSLKLNRRQVLEVRFGL